MLKWLCSPETYSSMGKWKIPAMETTCASSTATTPMEATSRCVLFRLHLMTVFACFCMTLISLCAVISLIVSILQSVNAVYMVLLLSEMRGIIHVNCLVYIQLSLPPFLSVFFFSPFCRCIEVFTLKLDTYFPVTHFL